MSQTPPVEEQQQTSMATGCDSIDAEVTATTHGSVMGDSSSTNNSSAEPPLQEEAHVERLQQQEEEERVSDKETTKKTESDKERHLSTTGQSVPGCTTSTISVSPSTNTNNYLTVVKTTATTISGRTEKYHVNVDEKQRPLHPPTSRLDVGVGVGAMAEGSTMPVYYQEYQTTPAVEMDVDDVEVGLFSHQPNNGQEQDQQSNNNEPEQHPNNQYYPAAAITTTEMPTGNNGDQDAPPPVTNNGAVATIPANANTEQDAINDSSLPQQEEEENPEHIVDDDGVEVEAPNDHSIEPPVTTEANNNDITPPAASNPVDNTRHGRQRQQRQQRQDLPQAVPVPEPPTLLAGTSLGSSSMGTSTALSSAVVQAQPLENWTEEKENKKCCGKGWLSPTQWAVGALLFVVLIVVGVVIGVTQAKGSSDDGNDNGSASVPPVMENPLSPNNDTAAAAGGGGGEITDAPSFPMFPPFSDRLNFVTLVAIEDPTTPQARANSWMMQDPHRELYDEDRQLQRFSLATLYYSTSGDSWDRNDLWLDYERDECQWYNQVDEATEGALCNEDSYMLKLNLSRNNLRGVLPVELFFFPALASLDLSHNGLYGTAPTMFAGARYLQRLVLSSNQLTGQFTAELGFVASQLAVLHNDDNQFTGNVPGLLRLLPQIKDLNITGNQYTGTLPTTLNQLSDTLTVLEVGSNSITGVLPTVLGLTTRLQVLDVGRNTALKGTIPSELSALVNLSSLNIQGTSVSGSLPEALCNLQNDGHLQVLADCGGQFQCCFAT